MKKVIIIKESTVEAFENHLNHMLNHDGLKVTNIQYYPVVTTSSRQPNYDGEVNLGSDICYTALVEYEKK